MDPVQRYRFMSAAALADGEVQDEEQEVLTRWAQQLGLSAEDARLELEAVKSGDTPALRAPEDEQERAELFGAILAILLADSKLDADELQFLERIKNAFGFSNKEVEVWVRRLGQNLEQLLSWRRPVPARRSFKMISCLMLLGVVALLLVVAVPNLLEARKHGNEAQAIGSLKTITDAQAIFREKDSEGDGIEDYGTLTELGEAGLIDEQLASGTKQGYTFQVMPGKEAPEYIWMAVANPVEVGSTGDRFFVANHEGVTYYTTNGPAVLDLQTSKISEHFQPG